MKLLLLLAFFQFSVTANDTLLQLENQYLNIAKTQAQSLLDWGPCSGPFEIDKEEIAQNVRKARNYFDFNNEYNEANNRKFKIDSVLTKVLANTLALKDIMNMIDILDPSTYTYSLTRVSMYGPSAGVYGYTSKITFKANNKIEYQELDRIGSTPSFKKYAGTYDVFKDERSIMIKIEYNNIVKTFRIFKNYSNVWVMLPEDIKDVNDQSLPYSDGYVDFKEVCSA